jgi:uncharacterized protein with gpF-like domain
MLLSLPSNFSTLRRPIRAVQPVRISRRDEVDYYVALNALNKGLYETNNRVKVLIEAGASAAYIRYVLQQEYDRQQSKYSIAAPAIAAAFIYALSRSNKKRVEATLAAALNAEPAEIKVIDPPAMDEFIKESIAENVRLIKTIPNIYFNDVSSALYKHFSGAPLPEGITERLSAIGSITKNRAAFIARDQVSKLNGQLTRYRHESVGIYKYNWRNSQDQRVVGNPTGLYPKPTKGHGDHWSREGKLYYYNNPPADGNPGYAYNCRCYAEGVLDTAELNVLYSKHE